MAEPQNLPGLRVIGLLGGVGSGKSSAARALADRLPATLLAADEEVARLLEDPQVAAAVERDLGPGLLGEQGRLDRRKVAARVFRDSEARARLEAMLHPAVRRRLYERLHALDASGRPEWAILDVPLLREGGLDAVCDFLVFIAVPDEVRCRRACERHGWSREEWAARESAQKPLEEKRSVSDAILDNGGSPEELAKQASSLLATLRSLPPRPLQDRWPRWDRLPPRQPPAPG